MFRNRIINGDMRINQRGSTQLTTSTSGVYFVDRFLTYIYNGAVTLSNIPLINTDLPFQYGIKTSLRTTISTACSSTTYLILGQHIEGYNMQDLNWGTSYGIPITVSFWSRTNGITQLPITIRNINATAAYNIDVPVTSSGVWQYNKVTIPMPSTSSVGSWDVGSGSLNGVGFSLYIGSYQNTGVGLATTTGSWTYANNIGTTVSTNWTTTVGNYVEFTGVQLEKGTIATPFEFRPYPIEMQLCQRYYYRLTTIAANNWICPAFVSTSGSTAVSGFLQIPQIMRCPIAGSTGSVFVSMTNNARLAIGPDNSSIATSMGINVTAAGSGYMPCMCVVFYLDRATSASAGQYGMLLSYANTYIEVSAEL